MLSVDPKPCSHHHRCKCYFAQDKGNTFKCKHLTSLPRNDMIPKSTYYLEFSANNITELYGSQSYLRNILGLNLKNGAINSVSENILNTLARGRIQILDLSNNNIQILPQAIKHIDSIIDIGLSQNPFVCNCETIWMKDLLITFNESRGELLRVKCNNGTPILKLDGLECFGKELPTWVQILIGLSAGLTILTVIVIIAISRRWNEVKWFMYLHFDILDKNDRNENLQNKEKDAVVSYRYTSFDAVHKKISLKLNGCDFSFLLPIPKLIFENPLLFLHQCTSATNTPRYTLQVNGKVSV